MTELAALAAMAVQGAQEAMAVQGAQEAMASVPSTQPLQPEPFYPQKFFPGEVRGYQEPSGARHRNRTVHTGTRHSTGAGSPPWAKLGS